MRARSRRRSILQPSVWSAPSSPDWLRGTLLRRRNQRAMGEHALVKVRTIPLWRSSLLATAGLVFVVGIALGEMAAGGAIIHALVPQRHFDIYFALHQQLVVGSLIGMSLLWLLPPHPWAKRVAEAADRDQPAEVAGEAGTRGPRKVTALSVYQGRDPPHRPMDSLGVGG
jgi:hypothetical protein